MHTNNLLLFHHKRLPFKSNLNSNLKLLDITCIIRHCLCSLHNYKISNSIRVNILVIFEIKEVPSSKTTNENQS